MHARPKEKSSHLFIDKDNRQMTKDSNRIKDANLKLHM